MLRALAAACLVAAVAAGCGGSRPQALQPTGYVEPAWLGRLVHREAVRLGDAHPRLIEIAFGRRRDTVEMHGRFTCDRECSYVGTIPPRGTELRLVIDPRTHEILGLGLGPGREQLTEVARARRASRLFRIFPSDPTVRAARCRFAGGTAIRLLDGWCSTRVRGIRGYSGETRVFFMESWHVGGRLSRGGWMVTLGPSGRVFGTQVTGATPPQLWK